MCGRARCTLRPDDYSRACHLNSARPVRHLNMDRYRPSYNVAPGFNVPVVRVDDEGDGNGVVLHCMKWGLIPSFTKKTEKLDHFRMFNARSESIKEKASFRRLLLKNRCLVSVEGFYEWKKDGSRKQPYYVHLKDDRPLVFAALYDSWKSIEGEILYTFTIVTTSSSPTLEWLHDRMPVILGNKESTDWWLSDSSSLSNLENFLKPYEGKDLAWYPVTGGMGKLSFDGPECIKEVKSEEIKPISMFFSRKNIGAPENPIHERSLTKGEPVEASEPRSVRQVPEGQPKTENAVMKDEPFENSQQHVNIKEEFEKSQEDHHQHIITRTDDIEMTGSSNSTISSPGGPPNCIDKRRDYEELSTNAKESGKTNITSPVRKRSKGGDNKQPTLFSYFGRS